YLATVVSTGEDGSATRSASSAAARAAASSPVDTTVARYAVTPWSSRSASIASTAVGPPVTSKPAAPLSCRSTSPAAIVPSTRLDGRRGGRPSPSATTSPPATSTQPCGAATITAPAP